MRKYSLLLLFFAILSFNSACKQATAQGPRDNSSGSALGSGSSVGDGGNRSSNEPVMCPMYMCVSSFDAKISFQNDLPAKMKVTMNGQTVLDECGAAPALTDENYVYRLNAREIQTGQNQYDPSSPLPQALSLMIEEIKNCANPSEVEEIFSVENAAITYIDQFKVGDPCYQDCRSGSLEFLE